MLDQRVTVQVKSGLKNGLNEPSGDWSDLCTISACVIQAKGREFLSGDFHAEDKASFVIRWRDDIAAGARVLWASKYWNISSVTGTQRTVWMELLCQSVDGAAP